MGGGKGDTDGGGGGLVFRADVTALVGPCDPGSHTTQVGHSFQLNLPSPPLPLSARSQVRAVY